MTRRKADRFDFLDEVSEPGKENSAQAPAPQGAQAQSSAYLLQVFQRGEPLAPLGNRIRLPAKHALEDYVRELKREGYPATEARVLEALLLLLETDSELKSKVSSFLTGKTD